ncbi:MAG: ROK family protein [Xanthomonadales bacterium]|nr:ROK family protein [Xanthomonadales bacterium]
MAKRTFSIDIGGSGIKGMVLDRKARPVNERVRIKTPERASPKSVLKVIRKLAAVQPAFDRVSIGFPGVVEFGVTHSAPNLKGDWSEVPLAALVSDITLRPCRVINDADMQGYGAIQGRGVEMMITLGTGMGAAIFTNGHLAPNLELGHHPWMGGESYEQRLGDAARKRIGNSRWSRRVAKAVDQMLVIWNPRVLYVGGGNAKKVGVKLPRRVKPVDNLAGILGGVRLWDDEAH